VLLRRAFFCVCLCSVYMANCPKSLPMTTKMAQVFTLPSSPTQPPPP
jgi:hypothetical protein